MLNQAKNMQNIHSGTKNPQVSEREIIHKQLAREMAAEGIVLLKNESILPLNPSESIALLGCGAGKTVKGGTGSGDVNNRENISIYRGLKEAGVSIVSEKWVLDYEDTYCEARNAWKDKVLEDAKKVENPFDAYAVNPFSMPQGRKITQEDIDGANTAVYVISRISGEGKDRCKEEGDYYLSKKEWEDILFLNAHSIPTILLINAGGPIELTDVLEKAENVKAVLNISQLGQEGGHAVVDVLLGKVVPGGKLTSTWAKRYEDYPYADTFGYLNGNIQYDEYKEGIYVGYRYFDSFGVEPLFPFGYGLSYTTFAMKFIEFRMKKRSVELDIQVENTGDSYAGRETVQIYATLPQTGGAKEYHRLVGFAKTAVLQPKESQKVTVTIEQKQFASFSEEMHAWYMESGQYGLWIGKDSVSLQLAAVLNVAEKTILEQTHEICPKKEEFSELGQAETAVLKEAEGIARGKELAVPVYDFVPEKEEERTYVPKPFLDAPVEELIPMLYGNITQGTSTLGSSGIRVPGSAGETSEALEAKYNLSSLIMADGPAGLRLRQSYEVNPENDSVYGVGVLGSLENGFLESIVHHEGADIYYQYCTAFPVGTALAQAWDKDLMTKFGEAIAEEMHEFGVHLWLAPGMNIHRNPLCGRNFEYYSEDPLLSGVMAAAVTAGVQSKKGCGVTIKHFACNNQEDNRMGVDARVSERALREIYARGFEIAVKKCTPAAIMTSYNLINGVHAANSKDLCTVLAREEWGFDGIIMSDWNTTCPEDGSVSWQCAAAGNDIIMPGNPDDDANIRKAFAQGMLTEEEIRKCAGRIIALIRRLSK